MEKRGDGGNLGIPVSASISDTLFLPPRAQGSALVLVAVYSLSHGALFPSSAEVERGRGKKTSAVLEVLSLSIAINFPLPLTS